MNRLLFPLGFPLALATNSAAVEATALGLWAKYPQLFDEPPARLRITVSETDTGAPAAPAIPRGDAHLITSVHGQGNRATADLAESCTSIELTRDVAADSTYLTHHFLEPFVYYMLAARRFTMVHASSVALHGKALLFCGDSGAGKTCLAWECARHGWTFLSGDASQLICGSEDFGVVGRPYSIRFRETAREIFPELAAFSPARGPNGKLDLNIATDLLHIATAPRAELRHFIFLDRVADGGPDLDLVPAEEAYAKLEQTIFYGPEELRVRQRATLRRYLQLPALRLRYSDLTSAEHSLRFLMEDD